MRLSSRLSPLRAPGPGRLWLLLVSLLACGPAQALPMSFPGSTTVGSELDPHWRSLWFSHALDRRNGVGLSLQQLPRRGGEGHAGGSGGTGPQGTEIFLLLEWTHRLKRWNLPGAQANLWLFAGVGGYHGPGSTAERDAQGHRSGHPASPRQLQDPAQTHHGGPHHTVAAADPVHHRTHRAGHAAGAEPAPRLQAGLGAPKGLVHLSVPEGLDGLRPTRSPDALSAAMGLDGPGTAHGLGGLGVPDGRVAPSRPGLLPVAAADGRRHAPDSTAATLQLAASPGVQVDIETTRLRLEGRGRLLLAPGVQRSLLSTTAGVALTPASYHGIQPWLELQLRAMPGVIDGVELIPKLRLLHRHLVLELGCSNRGSLLGGFTFTL